MQPRTATGISNGNYPLVSTGRGASIASQYDVARGYVGEGLATTEKLISDLENRLGSVLIPSCPSAEAENLKEPIPISSEAVEWFNKHNALQNRINNRLQSILERCQL